MNLNDPEEVQQRCWIILESIRQLAQQLAQRLDDLRARFPEEMNTFAQAEEQTGNETPAEATFPAPAARSERAGRSAGFSLSNPPATRYR